MLASARQALSRLSPWLVDGACMTVVFGLMAGQLAATRQLPAGQHAATPAAYGLALLVCAPIVTHRRLPRISLAVCLIAMLVYAAGRFAGYPGLAVFVLTFGITLHSDRRTAATTVVAAAGAMAGALALQPPSIASAGTWTESGLGIVVAWLAAENIRGRRARWAELKSRAERLERDRKEEARRAVTQERLRIARELHDVVAHSMSVIAVQSAVGNHVMDSQPEDARRALAAIEGTSRAALTEMRRLLGVLRQEGEPVGSLAPAPGLADLTPLVAQVADAGVSAWVKVEGEQRPLPPGVDLSAYRIVQEALTNVIKHAGSPTACVLVRYETDAVTVEITNDGPGEPVSADEHAGQQAHAGYGHGIIGMRERVAVFGGEFSAGPRPEGGYGVIARLPYTEVTT